MFLLALHVIASAALLAAAIVVWTSANDVPLQTGTDAPIADNADNVILMFVRAGAVIPTQESRLTIKEARATPFTLVATLSAGARPD
jgi:alpha-glucosidase (family GH31 glycosyl hydrolase)